MSTQKTMCRISKAHGSPTIQYNEHDQDPLNGACGQIMGVWATDSVAWKWISWTQVSGRNVAEICGEDFGVGCYITDASGC